MTKYAQHVSRKTTPQSEKAHPKQAKNNAGGFSFVIDDWARLDRFLILGADGGTYYVGERELTKQNAACVERCLDADPARTVETIVKVSDSGRAPKNDPAVFALALAASHPKAQALALAALPKVCRIGTHLFQFAASVNELRGWGRGLRRAVSSWYTDKPAEKLAYQALKYQARNGWSHRDLMRLAHPVASSPEQAAIFRWIAKQGDMEALGERAVVRRKPDKSESTATYAAVEKDKLPMLLALYEEMKTATDSKTVIRLITEHGFTHEMIPTHFKNDPEVWDALVQRMPITATIRNLAKMTNVGLIKPLSETSKLVCERIVNRDMLKKGRVHPIALLSALKVYEQGHGEKGSLKWEPVEQIVDALDEAFYLAFETIEPTGKNILIGLDVSGSMSMGTIAGVPGLTPRVAAAAMCMVTARSEKNYHVMAFCHDFVPLSISPRERLDAVVTKTDRLSFGGTDCSLPMTWALKHKTQVDAFLVYTDNETWAGHIHPHQALQNYRNQMGRAAKLVVVGMVSTQFTIANPDDAGMLDVVGFDTGAPAVMADFVRGERKLESIEGAGYRDAAMRETEA